jgi:hypothetical protein
MASIGDENAICAPAHQTGSTAMFKQSSTFEYRLTQEAINLRKQAEGMPLSIRRDDLLRKATEIDTAASMDSWKIIGAFTVVAALLAVFIIMVF